VAGIECAFCRLSWPGAGSRERFVIHSGLPVVSAGRRSILAGGCRGCEAGLPVWVVEEADEDEVPPPGETLKAFPEPFTYGIRATATPVIRLPGHHKTPRSGLSRDGRSWDDADDETGQ
jgi:hypothetical protein